MSSKTLGELVDIKGGKRLPKGSQLQSEKNLHPYIRVRDMGQRFIPRHGLEYVPEDVFPKISRYIVNENDVIISIVGTIGLVSIIDDYFDKASQTENCAKLSGLDFIDAHYLYYFLISSQGQQEIKEGTVGAVQAKLPLYNIEKINVYWPDRTERENVVKMLSDLDDKIQLNTQTNQTLEQIAQAIFKSWFVDFAPVRAKMAVLENGGTPEAALLAAMRAISAKDDAALERMQRETPEAYTRLEQTAALFPSAMEQSELGEVPEGWEIDKLSKLINFNPKRTLKKGCVAPYLDMKNVPTTGHLAEDIVDREMGSGTKFINGDTLLGRITPCLENGKTAYVDFLDYSQVGWGSTEYIVMRPVDQLPSSLGYFIARLEIFRQAAIQSMTGTSGRQRANANALADLLWVQYPSKLLMVFDSVAGAYLTLAKSKGNENKILAALRDTLLPKLLSGEISSVEISRRKDN